MVESIARCAIRVVILLPMSSISADWLAFVPESWSGSFSPETRNRIPKIWTREIGEEAVLRADGMLRLLADHNFVTRLMRQRGLRASSSRAQLPQKLGL